MVAAGGTVDQVAAVARLSHEEAAELTERAEAKTPPTPRQQLATRVRGVAQAWNSRDEEALRGELKALGRRALQLARQDSLLQ